MRRTLIKDSVLYEDLLDFLDGETLFKLKLEGVIEDNSMLLIFLYNNKTDMDNDDNRHKKGGIIATSDRHSFIVDKTKMQIMTHIEEHLYDKYNVEIYWGNAYVLPELIKSSFDMPIPISSFTK